MSERVPMGYTWWIVVEDKDRHIRHFVRDDRAERARLLLDIPVTPEEDAAWEAMEREQANCSISSKGCASGEFYRALASDEE